MAAPIYGVRMIEPHSPSFSCHPCPRPRVFVSRTSSVRRFATSGSRSRARGSEPVNRRVSHRARAARHRESCRAFTCRLNGACRSAPCVIGIPFYLAHPDLTALHGEQVGHIEGFNRADILRYLRHEMGHVVNYAYKLYDREAWVKLFGSITQPYREEYRPQPFSRRFVRHLPGWYAQKHPDEDWSETFAVWMTPDRDWRATTRSCRRRSRSSTTARARWPSVRRAARDGDRARRGRQRHSLLARSVLRELRARTPRQAPPAWTATCARSSTTCRTTDDGSAHETRPAAELIRRHERELMATCLPLDGPLPEKTRSLVRDLAKRAEALKQVYARRCASTKPSSAVTTLVTSLAMNFVHRGAYFPEAAPPSAEASRPPSRRRASRDADAPEDSSEPLPRRDCRVAAVGRTRGSEPR